jgi:hypothetical protein
MAIRLSLGAMPARWQKRVHGGRSNGGFGCEDAAIGLEHQPVGLGADVLDCDLGACRARSVTLWPEPAGSPLTRFSTGDRSQLLLDLRGDELWIDENLVTC